MYAIQYLCVSHMISYINVYPIQYLYIYIYLAYPTMSHIQNEIHNVYIYNMYNIYILPQGNLT